MPASNFTTMCGAIAATPHLRRPSSPSCLRAVKARVATVSAFLTVGLARQPYNCIGCSQWKEGKWFRGLDSNQDSQIQSLVACQLADPGMGKANF